MDSPLLRLIRKDQWGPFQPMMDQIKEWPGWPLFLEKLHSLKRDALYQSTVHGLGHIERTMLHGAFCAMAEPLDLADTALLLECCSYHDVGRVDDSLDDCHGARSAQELARLTGRTGEELKMMMAAVDAHARPEPQLVPTLEGYQVEDWDRAFRLAQLLKDADGLDRVRIWDLDIRHLRREASKEREDFAEYLYARYQEEVHAPLEPPFGPEYIARMKKRRAARRRKGQAWPEN